MTKVEKVDLIVSRLLHASVNSDWINENVLNEILQLSASIESPPTLGVQTSEVIRTVDTTGG